MMLARLSSVGVYVITNGIVSVRLAILFFSVSLQGMSKARCMWVFAKFLS